MVSRDNSQGREKAGRYRPSAGQLAARRELAEAREKKLERKRRTRRLIEVGGVMAAFGVETPEQAERLMETLVDPERGAWRRYLEHTLNVERTERWPEENE